jgi:peptidyl-prolyl cis-trans isomerase C
MSELDREMRKVLTRRPELQLKENMAAFTGMRRQALQYLIDRELIVQKGKEAGLQVQSKAVDAELAKVKKQFPSQDIFEQALKREGLTEKGLRNLIRRDLTVQEVREVKIKPNAKSVTDKDAADFYETNREEFVQHEKVSASHILIKISPEASDQEKSEAKDKMQAILKEAKGGADFAELAKKHSQCPSASRGGELGFFERGDMVEPFGETAFGMQTGQISDIVETQYGYHIILLLDRKPETQLKLEDVNEQIKEFLFDREMDVALQEWLKPIREDATIEILLQG